VPAQERRELISERIWLFWLENSLPSNPSTAFVSQAFIQSLKSSSQIQRSRMRGLIICLITAGFLAASCSAVKFEVRPALKTAAWVFIVPQ